MRPGHARTISPPSRSRRTTLLGDLHERSNSSVTTVESRSNTSVPGDSPDELAAQRLRPNFWHPQEGNPTPSASVTACATAAFPQLKWVWQGPPTKQTCVTER